jgi:hypothetical protein
MQLVANPLVDDDRHHMYQSVCQPLPEHIYHTLEPAEHAHSTSATIDGDEYDTLGRLEVMLPNGQMVPATLVRSAGGRIIPMVDVNSRTMPQPKWKPDDSVHSSPGHGPALPIQISFPKNNNTSAMPQQQQQHRRQFM